MFYLVADKITGEIIAENITSGQAAKMVGMSHYTSAATSAKRKHFPPGRYYVRRMGEYVEHEPISFNNPVLVTDTTTGKTKVFNNAKDISNAFYCNREHVFHCIKKGLLLFRKYRLTRLNYVGEIKEIGAI